MSASTATTEVTYITELDHVREVLLEGTADLRFWTTHLKDAALWPYEANGTAQLSITGTQLRWMGIKSRELTITLAISMDQAGHTHDGFYLLHAYNSGAALAWMERRFFHTPYYHAVVELQAAIPAQIRLCKGQRTMFDARMAGRSSRAEQSGTCWTGPIFLPGRQVGKGGVAEYFNARLAGMADVYPFDKDGDTLVLPKHHEPVWDWLARSGFAGREWRVRANATHARSRTYQCRATW